MYPASLSREDPKPEGGSDERRVCSAHEILSKDPCWVFSLGSNGQSDFEEAVRASYPHCKLHIFDPTISQTLADKVTAATGVR